MMRTPSFVLVLVLVLLLETSPRLSRGDEPAPLRPNILFAIADDWGYGYAGAYGCQWVKTPAFDRVAREGLLFTHAYTPTAKCAPSRAAIITGRYPWLLKAAANHQCNFPPEFKSFPEALGENGYFVGHTQKGWGPGVAQTVEGKPRQMTGAAFNNRKADSPTKGIGKNDYAGNFTAFLDAAPADKPWCFWFGALEPHRDYEYGSGVAKGGKKISDIDRVPACWPDNETVRNDMLDFAFEVEHFDNHLGRMLDTLEKRGLLENTLVVVTGDNGLPFPHDKGYAYHDSNHLPLAIRWPRGIREPGRTVNEYVSFIDFAPTFVEAAGLKWDATGMAPASGRSLFDVFAAKKSEPPRDHALVGKERNDVGRPRDEGYPIRGLVKNDKLYLHNFEPARWPGGNPETGYLESDGSPTKTEVLKSRPATSSAEPGAPATKPTEPGAPAIGGYWQLCFGMRVADEFFDLKSDPDCVTNLAGKVDFKPYQEQLFAELKAQGDPRMLGQGHVFDTYPNVSSKRGYYEKMLKGEKPSAEWANESDVQKSSKAEK